MRYLPAGMPLRCHHYPLTMVNLRINHIHVEVSDGATIMEAAAAAGIAIPSMCHRQGYANHPSCMVCLVKDADRGNLVPSCAMPVSEGMNILTDSPDVMEARKEALELLLSDHVGDCEAPCRMSCPALMDIPLMNRLIASGNFDQALHVVREDIALPLVLGYICPAPCEKACKRKPIDLAVSICLLKRAAAWVAQGESPGTPAVSAGNGKKVAIIGAGPAGLSAAYYLLRSGHACVLFDRQPQAGGAMQYRIPDDRLPKEMLDAEIGIIRRMGAEFRLGTAVTGDQFNTSIMPEFDAVILATGSLKEYPAGIFGLQPDTQGNFVDKNNFTTSVRGVFGCGNIVREQKMAVQSVAQGKMAAIRVGLFLATGVQHAELPGFNSVTGPLHETEWDEYLKESIPHRRVEPAGGFLAGFSKEEAKHEAQRCMHCDCRKPSTCKLRMYAGEYGANRRRFAGPDRKAHTRCMQHESVVYETGKCIRCGLCVEITEKHGEAIGLTFAGRGFDVRITVPFNEATGNALTRAAVECVEACPTGALSFKNQEERKFQ